MEEWLSLRLKAAACDLWDIGEMNVVITVSITGSRSQQIDTLFDTVSRCATFHMYTYCVINYWCSVAFWWLVSKWGGGVDFSHYLQDHMHVTWSIAPGCLSIHSCFIHLISQPADKCVLFHAIWLLFMLKNDFSHLITFWLCASQLVSCSDHSKVSSRLYVVFFYNDIYTLIYI